METPATLEQRRADLQARIDLARKHLKDRQDRDWAEIGNMLEALSRQLEHLDNHDAGARARSYEKLEADVADLHNRIGQAEP